jgi:folate-binding protein YgfZ
MLALSLHEYHEKLGGDFISISGVEVVGSYGDFLLEHAALVENVGVLDLSFRSRICLTGTDRIKFLHGQVTNDINRLTPGTGCYAALVSAKGRIQSDLNVYRLPDELLLDFEPGITQLVSQRLEKYVISEDVQITDVGPLYGLLSIQGPKARTLIEPAGEFSTFPEKPFAFVTKAMPEGEVYLMNHPRFGNAGYDLYLPAASLPPFAERLFSGGGVPCGWLAGEIARIEAGIPRFGADMDEANIALETGLENLAISFNKGCYIGQEVISRIRTYSEVAKSLRGLRLADDLKTLPAKDAKLYKDGKEAGYITSATWSPRLKANIALGYVRKGVNQTGAGLTLRLERGETPAEVVELPFVK